MAMRSAGASLLAILGPDTVDHAYELSARFLPQLYRGHVSTGKLLSKIVSILRSSSPEAMYQALVSTWANPEVLVQNAKEPITISRDVQHWPGLADIADKMMYLDMVTYLAGDILTKVDRASMNASLETRLPFLDPSLAAFAWRLPLSWKVRGTEGKLILRNLLYRNVPKDLVDRPKRGFGVPVAEWLRGPLRDWAESLLAPDILKRQGLLNVGLVDRTWTNHLSRKQFSPSQLWSVLMLQAWMQENDM
jgi:asparagine synthase (glutamine-hydrolysing)